MFCTYIVYPLVIFGSNVFFSNIFVNQHVPRAHPSPCPILHPKRAYDFQNEGNTNYKFELKCLNIFQIFILSFGMITLLRLSCLHLFNHVRYVRFTTNLSLLSKKKTFKQLHFSSIFLSLLTLGLLNELENSQILLLVVLINPNFGRLSHLLPNFSKIVSRAIFTTLSFYMFSIAITPATCILSLFVFQIWTFSFKKNVPYWVPMLLI
jgi:hypothetical protein